MGYLD